MADLLMGALGELRYEPVERRIRASFGGRPALDTTGAVLVWEPRRVVPSYAVPEEDVLAELAPSASPPARTDAPILHPGIPFSAHTTEGDALDVRLGDAVRKGAAFRPADPGLAGRVVLDFPAFDAWLEEEEPLVAHPRDPFHRIDVRPSSRHLRVELEGRVLAESARPTLLFETHLPTRFYLPADDVVAPLIPSARRTRCAYKGEASYWSLAEGGGDDIAWSYEHPLVEVSTITGLIAFFDDLVDVTLDGLPRAKPRGPIAAAVVREAFTGGDSPGEVTPSG